MMMVENDEQKKQSGRKRRRWLFVFALLAILLGPYLYFRTTSFDRKIQLVQLPDAKQSKLKKSFEDPAQTLIVATWNIAHGRGATDNNWEEGGGAKEDRAKEIAQKIVELDADLVILNEVDFSATWSGGFDQAIAIAKEAGYPYCLKQSNLDFGFIYGRWHFGNVLLSRYPLSEPEVVYLAPLNQWEDWLVGCKRGYCCTVELSADDSVSIIGLHLEARGEEVRVVQALDVAVVANQKRHPVILGGDLNTTPSWAPHSTKDTDGKNAFEVLEAATRLLYPPTEGAQWPNQDDLTYSTMEPKSVIDWVLYDPDAFRATSSEVIQTKLSDHFPVVVELEISK